MCNKTRYQKHFTCWYFKFWTKIKLNYSKSCSRWITNWRISTFSVNLSKLSDVLKNDVIKKNVCDKLVTEVNNIDTSGFASKTKYDADQSELGNKINFKITEIESKIPSISGLAASSALTAVQNEIPDISNLVKKTDYNTKISETETKLTDHNHGKYITTSEFNRLAKEIFDASLACASLVARKNFGTKPASLNKKTNSNKAKHLLVQNESKKLQTLK